MPMLHVLSTHGFLLSFNLLNFQSSRVDICSPPQNIADQSAMHQFQIIDNAPNEMATMPQGNVSQANVAKTLSNEQGNFTFVIPESGATSTPAKPTLQIQPKPDLPLNVQPAKPAMTSLFGNSKPPAFGTATGFGNVQSGFSGFQNLAGSEGAKPFSSQPIAPQPSIAPVAKVMPPPTTIASNESNNKPFLTVKPDYKPAQQTAK